MSGYLAARPAAVAKPRRAPLPPDQIAAFYLELRSPLRASLRRWKLPAGEAEDIVQETFVRLLSQSPANLNSENARYWLFRVAHNLAIDRQRSAWANVLDSRSNFDLLLTAHPSHGFDPEKIFLDNEQCRLVQANLAKLTPRQRHAINLRVVGLSYRAIAHELNGTTNSIAELIRRGLKRLGGGGE